MLLSLVLLDPSIFPSCVFTPTKKATRPSHSTHSAHHLTTTSTIKLLNRLLLAFTSSSTKNMSKYPAPESFPVQKTAEEWRAELSPEDYKVIRNKGTEGASTGEYDVFYPEKDEGYFVCKACKNPLYSAESKFKSGCGWPAFDKCFKGSVVTSTDNAYGMRRVEIMCASCGGHLGHVFEGERMTATNERHCVNSVSVKFEKGPIPDGLEEDKVV